MLLLFFSPSPLFIYLLPLFFFLLLPSHSTCNLFAYSEPSNVVTACISVALTYFQLSGEDYRWWWRSIFSSGSVPSPFSFLLSLCYDWLSLSFFSFHKWMRTQFPFARSFISPLLHVVYFLLLDLRGVLCSSMPCSISLCDPICRAPCRYIPAWDHHHHHPLSLSLSLSLSVSLSLSSLSISLSVCLSVSF